MNNLPTDWIDKIFNCMEKFYGEKWSNLFVKKFSLEFEKKIWFNGLNRLSYEQIKHGFVICKKKSLIKDSTPPSVIKFYYLCINKTYPENIVPRRTKK
jgi:hypothetical protein